MKKATLYKIWGIDQSVYGPVGLDTLISWIKDDRVTEDTWLFDTRKETWHKASTLRELKKVFIASVRETKVLARTGPQFEPGALRRLTALADLTDDQLERFASFMEVEKIAGSTELVKQGDAGDVMYMIVEGNFRVRLIIGNDEKILAHMGPGDCFGEMALFDDLPRSADVVADTDCTVLKVSKPALARLIEEAPELAAPFLLTVGKTLAARIRSLK